MLIEELLSQVAHRPWKLPAEKWAFYQEWNNAVFLHWKVDKEVLRSFVPETLELDLIDGFAWVSVVAFTMEKIKPRGLPSFKPISDFDELNIRTYVRYREKTGVHFLSIEAANRLSCLAAKSISELPYRYSNMVRSKSRFESKNSDYNDSFYSNYQVGKPITTKSKLDLWLTERYALFQDSANCINSYEIHHVQWPLFELEIQELNVNYSRFAELIGSKPRLAHYSTGVQVIAWPKNNTNS